MNKSNLIYFIFISCLITLFALYNSIIYTTNYNHKLSKKAIVGQKIWQQKNCFNCHQVYGLGGYLGPDLTNIYSNPNKGEKYIEAMLNSGVKSMPKYEFNKAEKDALISFLREIDKTGYFPDFNSKIQPNGWVEIKLKNEK